MLDPVEVHVIERTVYRFPKPDEYKCSAHGQHLCINCARNPASCGNTNSSVEGSGCSMYAESGMHWDTCPNRIR